MAEEHVAIYKDAAGDWRWVRIAANGERISSSTEGYENKSHAFDQAHDLNPGVEIRQEESS